MHWISTALFKFLSKWLLSLVKTSNPRTPTYTYISFPLCAHSWLWEVPLSCPLIKFNTGWFNSTIFLFGISTQKAKYYWKRRKIMILAYWCHYRVIVNNLHWDTMHLILLYFPGKPPAHSVHLAPYNCFTLIFLSFISLSWWQQSFISYVTISRSVIEAQHNL